MDMWLLIFCCLFQFEENQKWTHIKNDGPSNQIKSIEKQDDQRRVQMSLYVFVCQLCLVTKVSIVIL